MALLKRGFVVSRVNQVAWEIDRVSAGFRVSFWTEELWAQWAQLV